MSAARQSPQRPAEPARPPAEISALRLRRREAQRSRRLARVDVGAGVLAALMLLIVSPGLAITGLIAVLVLTCLILSALGQRQVRRRVPNAPRGRSRPRS